MVDATITPPLPWLMSTRGGGRNSSDGKLNKQRVTSTLQYVLFIMNPNKVNVAKLGHTSVAQIPIRISHKLCDRMDGTQFLCFLWFPANFLLCIMLRYTGGPPLTQKSLTRFPLPRFLAYVCVSGGISISRGPQYSSTYTNCI